MTESATERTSLRFGYNAGLPTPRPAAYWGARLIAPSDLLWDRVDMIGSDEQRGKLAAWLDPGPDGGAIGRMKDWLDGLADAGRLRGDSREEHWLEDGRGVIVANTNASYGYVYVAAWLEGGEGDGRRGVEG
jgi:hypothetical protein